MLQLSASSTNMTPYYSIVIGVALSLILCAVFTVVVRYSRSRQRARCGPAAVPPTPALQRLARRAACAPPPVALNTLGFWSSGSRDAA